MADGMILFNDAGGLQVSNRYVAWGLTASGSITLVDDGLSHPQPIVVKALNALGNFPIVAIRPRGGVAVGCDLAAVFAGGISYRLLAQSNVPVVVDYWVFDAATNAQTDASMGADGLIVWDDFGVVTQNLSMYPMSIKADLAPGMSTAGLGENHTTSASYAVPAGQSHAVIIAAPAHISTMWDGGSYSTEPGGGIDELPGGGGGGPGPEDDWKNMYGEVYIGAVQFSGGVFTCGMERIERHLTWHPIGSAEILQKNGNPLFTVVDVTGYGGGGGGGPTVMTVTANTYLREVTTPTGGDSISPAVTISVGGAVGGVTLAWERVGGSTAVVNNSSLSANPFTTKTLAQLPGTIREAQWSVKATDSGGNVAWLDQPITFRHSAGDSDFTPDAVDWPNISASTTGLTAVTSGATRTISGITSSVVLHAVISGLTVSGAIAESRLDMFANGAPVGGSGGLGEGYWAGGAVNNNATVFFIAHLGASNANVQASASYTVTVWNRSVTPNVVVDTFTVNQTANVADTTPDAMNWANISFVTDDNIGAGSNAIQTITGINRAINLRFTLSSVSHNFDGGNFYLFKNGANVANSSGFGNGYWAPVDVVTGDNVFAYFDGVTTSGRRTFSATVTVTNTTTGATVDTFTMSGVLDNNDNWNNADYTPNPISVPALTLNTNDISGYTQDRQFQVLGINQPIILRFTRANQVDSGGIFTRRLFIYHSTNGGASYVEYFIGAGPQGIADITVNNGDYILLRAYFDTTGGRGVSSFTGYVTNHTTGVQLASFSVSGTVDADDNYDRVRITFDGCTLDTTAPSGNTTASFRQVSGLTRPHVLRFTRDDINSMYIDGNIIFGRGIIAHSTVGSGGPWTYYTLGAGVNAAVEVQVNNGDWLYVQGYVETSSGIARAAWSSYMTDLTTGEYLGSWYTNGLVDLDNNFNVVALSVHVANPYSFVNQFMGSGQFYSMSASPSATVGGGVPPYTYKWNWIGGDMISVSSTTVLNPTFSFNGTTSWAIYSEYQLVVTDSVGAETTGGFTADWKAGDQA